MTSYGLSITLEAGHAESVDRAEPSVGLLLPCNVVVRSIDETHTVVEAMDPAVLVSATGNPDLVGVAEQARTRLQNALSALGSTEVVS